MGGKHPTFGQRQTIQCESIVPRKSNRSLIHIPKFQFRISPSWKTKPILKPNDPGRTQDRGAFEDEDPDFFLEHVGPSHTLILNKFCVVRPQYVLHTTRYERQSDKLSALDLEAAWSVLSRLESEHIVIFNCGVEAGASQGHKHLQILPRPKREEFELFPDLLGIDDGRSMSSYPHDK